MKIYELHHERRNEILLSTDKSKLDITTIYNFLKTSYWAKDVLISVVEKSINNSLCFGVYEFDKQIGFARVISDYATFAYFSDVFILEAYRGQGLGTWLIKSILLYSELQNLRTWLLSTADAHELYRQFGFENLPAPERMMVISGSSAYR
ncbi:GNAT family N-acetyltransferase [Synechocystis sp. PCC 7509]|uniref:GNAT family N-acetyltransferase n=1 Tax=Synechocystis sp. PCC 7509 TaxID=927677 RepID=UPI0002ABC201|nr:GNAT family N-acetyltransferase [Synechocystis sp. PCC 7509]